MVSRSVRIRVQDILDEIATIAAALDGMSAADFGLNVQTRRVTERCLEIISEASRHIPQEVQTAYPLIPWRSIRDIGNVLRHDYGRVDDRIIWRVATESLPDLATVMEQVLLDLPPDPES